MKKKYFLFLLFLCFSFFKNEAKELENLYSRSLDPLNDDLKSIILYSYTPSDNFNERYNNPAVLNRNSPNSFLILEFDDLRAKYASFSAKIIHCDYDWKKSNLAEMEYLEGFNEFYINNYDVSQNTKT
ncbi:MAG: hypothetical protein CFE22_18400, partial [Cytophagaceae bacterium BCCC1]